MRHPHIIQLYEIIETEKCINLVMEYVENGELYKRIINQNKLNEEEALRFFQQIISAVEYLHKIGVCHR